MKRSIIIGSVLVLVVSLSSCKKEVFQPNDRTNEIECGDNFQHKAAKSGGEVDATNPTGSTGGITDPNDDDYTKRPTKTKK